MKRTLDLLFAKRLSVTEAALVQECLAIVRCEVAGWTHRSDDAKRIPEVIHDIEQAIWKDATERHERYQAWKKENGF